MAGVQEKENDGYVQVKEEREEEEKQKKKKKKNKSYFEEEEDITLYAIFNRLLTAVVFPNSDLAHESASLPRRIKDFVSQNAPLLRTAFKNSAHHVLLWTRRGSHLRALLVVAVSITDLFYFILIRVNWASLLYFSSYNLLSILKQWCFYTSCL